MGKTRAVAALAELAEYGPSYGVHLVITVGKWSPIPLALEAGFGGHVELFPADPSDSPAGEELAARVPHLPGFSITADGHQLLTALPPASTEIPIRDHWNTV
ncbi:FtsK/SpoIIIE domain-containing protein [Nocardia carnea]|uniref:FtsK/SpoIIIE domain-containing protein n=1 Tax=Nocardia carnea TaxID=37328 RepID=A0ABW7TIH5_9NOCA|nr:FtsK/SpoIIIE domain-containing protein [Nocardia carnea]